MIITCDNADELADALEDHATTHDVNYIRHQSDGSIIAELVEDHPCLSQAALELRKYGLAYETTKPILRRMIKGMM